MAEETPEHNEETTEAAEQQPAGAEATEAAEAGATAEAGAGGEQAEQPAAEEKVSPRQRRAAERRQAASRRPPRTPEERQEERAKERAAKAAQRRRRRERTKAKAKEAGSTRPAPQVQTTATEGGGRQKVRQGVVVSAKPDKTITVRIDVARRHRRYEKIVRSSMTLHAHDERNEASEGDTVRVVESRPLSRTKRWRLVDVLERAR